MIGAEVKAAGRGLSEPKMEAPPPGRFRPVAHGVDLVEVPRIRQLRLTHGQRFLERCFTASERAYALEAKRCDERLAARFAAKEATLKALGTGLAEGIRWSEVEVGKSPSGAPVLRLSGTAATTAKRLGIDDWLLSLSHVASLAMASVIGIGVLGAVREGEE